MAITQLFIYGYVFIFLTFLAFVLRGSDTRHSVPTGFLKWAIRFNALMILLEGLSWHLDGATEPTLIAINYIALYLIFACNFAPVLCLIIYYDLLLVRVYPVVYKRMRWLIIPQLTMWLLAIINPWLGVLFTIDSQQVYRRGPLMPLIVGLVILTLLIYFISVLRRIRYADGRLVGGLLLLTIVPVLGAWLQILFYGLPAMWTSLSLLILFTFVVVEREELQRDGLTRLKNRSQFDEVLFSCLKKPRAFTLVMVDLDDFKDINDTLGHDVGDQALQAMAQLLECAAQARDIVARYGGDEFMVLLHDPAPEAGEHFEAELYNRLSAFHQHTNPGYSLKASVGHVHIPASRARATNVLYWLGLVDDHMYASKAARKQNKS